MAFYENDSVWHLMHSWWWWLLLLLFIRWRKSHRIGCKEMRNVKYKSGAKWYEIDARWQMLILQFFFVAAHSSFHLAGFVSFGTLFFVFCLPCKIELGALLGIFMCLFIYCGVEDYSSFSTMGGANIYIYQK